MMWWNDGWNGMMGGTNLGLFAGLTWLLIDAVLVLLLVWLWQKIQDRK